MSVKKLTSSDLTLFRSHYDPARSRQKAVNLSAEPFTRFFPSLVKGLQASHPVNLNVIGPGNAPALNLARKVVRSAGAKNWRLNGELVNDPDDEPNRFSALAPDDFALFAFDGGDRPDSVTMILVSGANDGALHAAIEALPGWNTTMIELGSEERDQLCALSGSLYGSPHPLSILEVEDTVEDALFGIGAGSATPARHVLVRRSPEEVSARVLDAQIIGSEGELEFRDWLLEHGTDDFEWTASEYAHAPYDFRVRVAPWQDEGHQVLHVDVKTTRGGFENPIHMSGAELRFASSTPGYRIARLSRLGTATEITILGGVRELASDLVTRFADLPAGIAIDSVQIDPSMLEVVHRSTLEGDAV